MKKTSSVTKVPYATWAFANNTLSGYKWADNSIEFAFPLSKSDYSYGPEAKTFSRLSEKMEAAIRFGLDLSFGNKANDGFSVEGFTDLKITEAVGRTSKNAEIRFGFTNTPSDSAIKHNWPAYANLLKSKEAGQRGDVWFYDKTMKENGDDAVGGFGYLTALHETGHALGLKHTHEDQAGNEISNPYFDHLSFSVMSYRGYQGQVDTEYRNSQYGYPQSYMVSDIAALQHMYGVSTNVNKGDTNYSWTPNAGHTWVNGQIAIKAAINTIFATIYDGGGVDTYDLSQYITGTRIQLYAGGESKFSDYQVANLGDGHKALGNIWNALSFNDKGIYDQHALIENVIGGKGDDYIFGNEAANKLEGGEGQDYLQGRQGNDVLIGGAGNDHLEAGDGKTTIGKNSARDELYGGDGNDRLDTRETHTLMSGGSGDDDYYLWGKSGRNIRIIDDGGTSDRLYCTSTLPVNIDGIEKVFYTNESKFSYEFSKKITTLNLYNYDSGAKSKGSDVVFSADSFAPVGEFTYLQIAASKGIDNFEFISGKKNCGVYINHFGQDDTIDLKSYGASAVDRSEPTQVGTCFYFSNSEDGFSSWAEVFTMNVRRISNGDGTFRLQYYRESTLVSFDFDSSDKLSDGNFIL